MDIFGTDSGNFDNSKWWKNSGKLLWKINAQDNNLKEKISLSLSKEKKNKKSQKI